MKAYLSSAYPVLLWIAAFVCALYPINALQLELFGATIALLFLWAYLLLGRRLKTGWEIPQSPVLLIALLFFLLVFFSVFWSEVKPISLMGVCFFSVMPISFVVGVLNKDSDYFRRVALMLAPVFAVLAIWAMIQFFFLNSYFFGQARHPLGDPSSLGALFSLALFGTLGWTMVEKAMWRKSAAIILAILLCGGIMATVARGPIFAFIPGIITFIVLLWPQVKGHLRPLILIVAGAGVVLALNYAPVLKDNKQYDVLGRVGETISFSMEDVSNNRMNIWKSTWDIIQESPILGKGISTYFMYYGEHRLPTETAGTFHAHNDPLQFWAELGILGPILFYAFVIGAGLRTFAALKKLEAGQEKERIVIVTTFAALVSLVVHSHVGFNLYNLSVLMLTGFVLSVWFHYTGLAVKDKVKLASMPENSPALANMALLALPFLMLGAVFLSLIAGEHYVNRARDDLFRGEMFSFADHINKAGQVSHGMNSRAYTMAVNVPMAILERRGKNASKEQQANLYKQVMGYTDAILQLNPRASEAYYYRARIQQMVDDDIVAEGSPSPEELYKKSLQYDPMHLGSRMALAGIYSQKEEDKGRKEDVLEAGENFSYNSPLAMEYYQVLATSYLEAGNYVKSREAMQKALDFKRRSDFSHARLNTTIPQAIANDGNVPPVPVQGEGSFPQTPFQPDETSGKKDSGL